MSFSKLGSSPISYLVLSLNLRYMAIAVWLVLRNSGLWALERWADVWVTGADHVTQQVIIHPVVVPWRHKVSFWHERWRMPQETVVNINREFFSFFTLLKYFAMGLNNVVTIPSYIKLLNPITRKSMLRYANLPISELQEKWVRSQKINKSPGTGTPQTFGWGCAARFSKPWPYYRPKYIIFQTLFQTT